MGWGRRKEGDERREEGIGLLGKKESERDLEEREKKRIEKRIF